MSISHVPVGRTFHVNNGHPQAGDGGPGTEGSPFLTISRAAELAQPGDTVLVHPGVYREHVAPARGGEEGRPITYQAAPEGHAAVRGSAVWSPDWRADRERPGVFTGAIDPALVSGFNPYAVQAICLPGRKTLGQVFVDGMPLTEVDDEADLRARPGTWRASPVGDALAVHFPLGAAPGVSRVEVTVRASVFAPRVRGLGHIHLRGLTFEHCANQGAGGFWESDGTQAGAVSCRAGHHWVIADCVIRYAKSIGLDCGGEGGRERAQGPELTPAQVGRHRIENNTVSDNGECGITGLGQTGTQVLGNVVERNNCLGYGCVEEAGIKFHYFYDGLIAGNLVRDNDGAGIWLDNVWYGSRVTRNVVVGNLGQGIFVEMGDGPCLVDTNVVGYTRVGDGIYTHDASGVTVAHNLLCANAHFGVYMRTVTERAVRTPDGGEATVGTRRQRVLNNVFVDNYRGHVSLPAPSTRAGDNVSDHNLFLGGTQWQWEGLGLHPFVLNTDGGRASAEALADALCGALEAAGIPPEQRPDRRQWAAQPYLTLEWWRLLTGHDRHSAAPHLCRGGVVNGAQEKGSVVLAARAAAVEFRQGEALEALTCPPVPGVASDLRGHPLPGDSVRPGPFQAVRPGPNHFPLWPPVPQEE